MVCSTSSVCLWAVHRVAQAQCLPRIHSSMPWCSCTPGGTRAVKGGLPGMVGFTEPFRYRLAWEGRVLEPLPCRGSTCTHVESCMHAHICMQPADCPPHTCIRWHISTRAHNHSHACALHTQARRVWERVMQAQSETPDASLALAAGAKGQERAAGGCPRWGLERGSAAEETEGAGRAGAARRGAAQRGRPLLVVRDSAPGPPALHHRSPAPVAWAWSPRHPRGLTPRPQTRSGR